MTSSSPAALPPATINAAICAGLALAAQVAGKAARDAIFLGQFHVTSLPVLMIVASPLSIVVALAMAHVLARRAPGRVVPLVNVLSAALIVGEWVLFGRAPRAAAIVIYVHQSMFGALLVSGFYSVVSECFDPRSARRAMGAIGGGATLGGLAGAILAERAGALFGVSGVLPMLAGVQLLAAWRLASLASSAPGAAHAVDAPAPLGEAVRSFGHVELLRHLTLLVIFGTVGAALLDYVFKARAAEALSGLELLRFFAVFYGAVSLVTTVIQWSLGRRALESWGIARTLATLPAAVAGFGAAALALPGLFTVVAARGAESVLKSSLYRQAYEVLFTPLPARDKRATKTVIDVGVERLGDAIGGGLVALALLAGAANERILLGGAVALAIAGLWVAARVQKSYVAALERGLVARAIELDLEEVSDRTSRATIHRLAPLAPSMAERPHPIPRASRPSVKAPVVSNPPDALMARAAELRCGDAERVRAALEGAPLPPALVAHAIPLLAWDEVAHAATQALGQVAQRAAGQLTDALLDPDEEFAVRRRLPRVLAHARSPRIIDGLLSGLADSRFEVRYRCASALARMRQREADLAIDSVQVYAALARELAIDGRAWADLQVIDEDKEPGPLIDDLLQDRTNRGLEQVFTLLTLVLPAEPIRIAFRGLHTDDRNLRGTALEYLEHVLPDDIREPLWPRLETDAVRPATPRPSDQVIAELVLSNGAIQVNLQALRGQRRS